MNRFDFLGIAASVACMIHCALPAILLGFAAFAGNLGMVDMHGIIPHEWEKPLELAFVGLAWLSVYQSQKGHQRKNTLIPMYFAVGLFSVSVLLHETLPMAIYVSLFSSATLVFFHGYNLWFSFRTQKACKVK